MKKLKIILVLLFLPFLSGFAQSLQESNAIIYIKLGNSLRRTHQNQLAEAYIKRGLATIKGKDKFWEATAYEHLGLIYRDMGDEEKASQHFLQASNLYSTNKDALAEKAIGDLIEGIEASPTLFQDSKIAPPKSVVEAIKLIKTANTLIEAKQYILAQSALEIGLAASKDNKYWEASAYEYLGFLALETGKNTQAMQHFKSAQEKYLKLSNFLSVEIMQNMLRRADQTEDVYAGIEIGSKGIKASVIGIKINKDGEYKFNIKFTEVDNSQVIAPTHVGDMIPVDKMESAGRIIKYYHEKIQNDFSIQPDRIFIVGSSAVATAKNTDALRKKIQDAFFNPSLKIDFVNPNQELEYDILGTIPDKKLFSASLIDLGAGSLKGGCLLQSTTEERKTFSFNSPYGAETFKELIKEEQKKTKGEYSNTAKALLTAKVENGNKNEIAKNGAFKNRKEVYLIGGVVWAMATYLLPQSAEEPYVNITTADIGKIRDLSALAYDKLINPDLSKVSGSVQEKAKEDINKAKEVFNKESLIAGSLLLASITNELNQPIADKKFFFARGGLTGWISGYTVHFISENYKKLKEIPE